MTTTTYDPEPLNEIKAMDLETYLVVIDCYLEDAPEIYQDLQQALAASDAAQLREYAHKLKGSSSTIGLTAVAEQAKHIEMIAKSGSCVGCENHAQSLQSALQETINLLQSLKQQAQCGQ